MKIISTELNERLSEFINTRVSTDESYYAARTTFWRLLGFGTLAFGIGTACGVAFYGYSYMNGNSEGLTIFSSTLALKLSEIQLKATAEGTVKIEPNEIAVAKGQSILIDSNSRLHLEQPAQIQVGEIKIQIPSTPQVQQTKAPIIKQTFTVFKSVPFGKGTIMTGWDFMTSAQKSPTDQFCYYSENIENEELNVVIYIAEDHKIREKPNTIQKDFDMTDAFNKCVWFKE